jgi:CheY-like chemotaxis protein
LRAARVLVVDDSDDMRESLRGLLTTLVAEIKEARNGIELVAALADGGPFDLIVTDVRMPWLDGLDAAVRIRRAGIDTPLVVMTAYADADARNTISGLSRACLLPKPFTIDELLATAREVMQPATPPGVV